jgi:hypothetical protein
MKGRMGFLKIRTTLLGGKDNVVLHSYGDLACLKLSL